MTDPNTNHRYPYLLTDEPREPYDDREDREQIEREKAEERADWERENPREH